MNGAGEGEDDRASVVDEALQDADAASRVLEEVEIDAASEGGVLEGAERTMGVEEIELESTSSLFGDG